MRFVVGGNNLDFVLTGTGPGVNNTSCLNTFDPNDLKCSVFAGSPFILSPGTGGTTVSFGTRGTVTDSSGGPSNWNGMFSADFPNVTPLALRNMFINNGTLPGATFGASFGITPVAIVVAPPVVAKSFGAPTVPLNGITSLSFVINNPNTGAVLNGVGFTDTLPLDVLVATPNGLTGSCGGGTITAMAGLSTVSLTGATIGVLSSCTFSVNVTGTTPGVKTNTVTVTSTNGGTGNSSTASLAVVASPTITKAFGIGAITVGGTTSLTFTIVNPSATVSLTGVGFTDTLPSGLIVATPNGLVGSCGGGTITALSGSNSIILTGATLAAGASCTFSLNVTATGTPGGLLTNTTGTVSSDQGPLGGPAIATIFVGSSFQTTFASNLNIGDSVFNITNAGTTNIAGALTNICANVYTFSPDEQLISCCSCIVTPNALVSLSANSDLVSNTLTPAHPTSIVVKVVATVGNTCNAANVQQANLANGLLAWGTTLHAAPTSPVSYQVTENPFSPASLSAAELARISSFCGFIQSNGSGFGICRSCRLGAQGAAKQ